MKIVIPIIEIDLYILIGKEGLKEYKKQIHKHNKDWEPDKNICGYCAENYIWLYKYNRKTLIHEIIHFLDWLYKYISCEDEPEFKAFLGEYIIDTTLSKFKK